MKKSKRTKKKGPPEICLAHHGIPAGIVSACGRATESHFKQWREVANLKHLDIVSFSRKYVTCKKCLKWIKIQDKPLYFKGKGKVKK